MEKWEKFQRERFERRIALRKQKQKIYTHENIHENFYNVSEILTTLEIPLSPQEWCFCLIIHKIQRLANYLKNPGFTIEPIQDTLDDLNNYIDILSELLLGLGKYTKD